MKLLAQLMTSRYQSRSDAMVTFVKSSEAGGLGGLVAVGRWGQNTGRHDWLVDLIYRPSASNTGSPALSNDEEEEADDDDDASNAWDADPPHILLWYYLCNCDLLWSFAYA